MIKNKEGMNGFTLLEAMITMVIVSVGLLAMAQMLMTTIKQNSGSEARMEGAVLAEALLTEASSSIASAADCVPLMPVQIRDKTNSARAGQNVIVKCTVLANSKYLLEATVTDAATGRITKNQRIYSDTQNASVGTSVASAGTGVPTPTPPATTPPVTTPPATTPPVTTPPATTPPVTTPPATTPPATTPPATTPPVTTPPATTPPATTPPAGGTTTWLDVAEVNNWLSDKKFQKGFDKNKKDVKKFNQCGALSSYAPVSNPPTATDITNINAAIAALDAGTVTVQDSGAFKNAKGKYDKAVKEWNNGKPKNAGKEFARMLKELAKAAGC